MLDVGAMEKQKLFQLVVVSVSVVQACIIWSSSTVRVKAFYLISKCVSLCLQLGQYTREFGVVTTLTFAETSSSVR